jgi:hypothetical protein
MSAGKADKLKKVAVELACAKCHINPRFGSLARCKQCLKADADAERVARERLLPAQTAARSARQQGAASRVRKPPAVPTGRALVPARPVQPVPKQTHRHGMDEPFTLKTWAAMGARWLSRFLGAKPAEQREKAERAMAAEHTVQNAGFARITYGEVPLIALYPESNEHLSQAHWGLERQGVRIDTVDVLGDIRDVKRLCPHCDARVRVPCNDSRANSCPNRSRGNR